MKYFKIVLLILAAIALSSCANHVDIGTPPEGHTPAGFLDGLFNGMVVGLAFIGNLLGGDYALYAAYNNGLAYDFGYVCGFGGLTITINRSQNKGE